jgi:hypothetical protein
MSATYLPPFWIPFLLVLSACILLAWLQDVIHGPQRRGHPDQWTKTYTLCIHYAAWLVFLAAACALIELVLWTMGVA